jgi:hypothetical protein
MSSWWRRSGDNFPKIVTPAGGGVSGVSRAARLSRDPGLRRGDRKKEAKADNRHSSESWNLTAFVRHARSKKGDPSFRWDDNITKAANASVTTD